MITRPQPYRLDFLPAGVLIEDERQLGAIVESSDRMFEMLFTDLASVEGLIGVSTVTLAIVAAMIATAIAAIPPIVVPTGHYSVLTDGYVPAPELVFALGDVVEVWVP